MGKFGSRSIAFRPKQSQTTYQPSKFWRGPFRFFDLPPELRDHILRLVLLSWDSPHKDVLHLFLTSRRMYTEAASMFYHEVLLDNTQLKGTADPFLTGPLTSVTPRIHVRNLIIRFSMRDQIHTFGESYGTALRGMAEHGNLQHLRLEILECFPSSSFWGLGDDLYYDDVQLVVRDPTSLETWAPLIITTPKFQNFLKFLDELNIPKVTLWVDAEDHYTFWCPFHRAHPSGKKCGGEWRGKAKLLRVQWKRMFQVYRGAQVARPQLGGP
ncbi:hypothetical protein F4779DRAFT_632187 [Xylariaceae sp. FL0662B]|nr:hypothetical protein F4779DRAFT_632187 [Xylariaceae sp. FL0662B]